MGRTLIVLDTHAALWWSQEPELLSATAAEVLERTSEIAIPAIVFWEVALLVRKGRLALRGDRSAGEWAQALQDIPRVHAVPLTPELAIAADALEMHADPADRFIVATALSLEAPLLTKDRLLRDLAWTRCIW